MSKSNSQQKPTLMPPQGAQSKSVASGKTTPMENISLASAEIKKGKNGSGTTHLAPTMPPPSPAKTGEAAVSNAAIWNKAATINGLWSNNENNNSWFSDAALGWKKISDLSDSGIVALTMLSSHAKQKGSAVDYRTEDDNLVHEMYVW